MFLNSSDSTHYLLLLSFNLSQLFFLLENPLHVNLYLFSQKISKLLGFNAVSLSELTRKNEWIIPFTNDDIRLLSIGIPYIYSDCEDFSSLISFTIAVLVLAA